MPKQHGGPRPRPPRRSERRDAAGRANWRRRRLVLEPLEDRRLLSGASIAGGQWQDLDSRDAAAIVQARLPDALGPPAPTVDPIVSDATREALQIEGGPLGLVQLRDREMLHLASGPAPSELRIRTPFNVNAADTTNTDQLQMGGSLNLDLTGSGYTVGVWDAGLIRNTHQEFGDRVTLADSGSFHYHSTHVGGTIGASGTVASAQGMATQVALRSRDWTNDLAEISSDAALIDVSNHSYGYVTGWAVYPASSYGFSTPSGSVDVWFEDRYLYASEDTDFGKYSGEARELDVVLQNNPGLLSVWAASNDRDDAYTNASTNGTYVAWFSGDPGGIGWSEAGWYLVSNSSFPAPGGDGNAGAGYDSIGGMQTAKNALVVGAVNDVLSDPYTSGQIVTTGFSSYGPMDDGRIKPDVVGNGAGLYSTDSSSDTAYTTLSGTSMATPNVAGTAVLLIEHFEDEFLTSPRSATTKGVLIHTAADAGNAGPDYAYGWGLVDAAAAATFITDSAIGTAGDSLQERTYAGTEYTRDMVSLGSAPLKFTLVWTDPAGTVQAAGLDVSTPVLVHDLDLWVTGPGGTYYPWTLNPANPTSTAVRNQANHVDNVEQVLIDAPAAGTYTIHVGHTGTPLTQDYTLLVSGGLDQSPPTVDGFTPADDAAGVAVVANLAINFNEPVRKGVAGNITIKQSSDHSTVETIPASSSRVTISGDTATIDTAADLLASTDYYVLADSGVFEDLAGNAWAGISSAATWNFTTGTFIDFGDAPAPYPTRLPDGARHAIAPSFRLGSAVDDELDGQPHWTAASDDRDSTLDDEDGVVFTSALVGGQTATVTVTASAAGNLSAWIDFNSDGDWADGGEQIFADQALVPGANALGFAVPLTPPGVTYARFRFSHDTGLSFSGPATDGEVEDYAFGTISGSKWDDADGDGIWDGAESGLAGWTVFVDLDEDRILDADEPRAVTGADGGYTVTGLPPGTHRVLEVQQAGWDQSHPGLASGSSAPAFLSVNAEPDGDMPREAVFTPDGQSVLVVHRDTDNLVIYDADTRSVTATIPVGRSPVDVAVTPNGQYALVPNLVSNTVSIVDLTTRTVAAHVPITGSQPYAVRVTADGAHAVVGVINDAVSSSFSVISLATLAEVRSFASAPQGAVGFTASLGMYTYKDTYTQFAIRPDNATIVLADTWNAQVVLYDLNTGAELAALPTAAQPWSVDISRDGTIAVVGHTLVANAITKLDLVARTADTLPVTGAHSKVVRITADNQYALVPIDNNVLFVDLATGATAATLSTGALGDIELSFDGKYAFVSSSPAAVIDVAS
ncbi:MAG: S8 family serine peptidase, partial [Pirellulaceae bacterium]|nr:S8 family serine peptidase [Pirellulaceae bacterium]